MMMRRNDKTLSPAQRKARSETDEAREWLLSRSQLSEQFIKAVDEPHPALWFARVMELVAESIEKENHAAVELGCFYISDDPKAPFGRILKRRVMNALRRRVNQIPKRFHQGLLDAYAKLQALPHPPQELKDLGRLVRALTLADNSIDAG
jgi:hypothetical protein